jgi:hypothetical protein
MMRPRSEPKTSQTVSDENGFFGEYGAGRASWRKKGNEIGDGKLHKEEQRGTRECALAAVTFVHCMKQNQSGSLAAIQVINRLPYLYSISIVELSP